SNVLQMVLSGWLSFTSVANVMCCAAAAHFIIDWSFGAFIQIMSRSLLCCIAVTSIAGLLAVMCLWIPVNDDPAMFFVMAVSWGISTGLMDALVTSKYSALNIYI